MPGWTTYKNVQTGKIQLINNALSVNIYAWVKFDIFSSATVVATSHHHIIFWLRHEATYCEFKWQFKLREKKTTFRFLFDDERIAETLAYCFI